MSRHDKFLQPIEGLKVLALPGEGLTPVGIARARQQIANGESPDAVVADWVKTLEGVTFEDIARQLRLPAQDEADLVELDTIVRDSLKGFVDWIFDPPLGNPPWRGREREAVSLYVRLSKTRCAEEADPDWYRSHRAGCQGAESEWRH